MAITADTENGADVIHCDNDADSYADLLAAKATLTSSFNEDTDLPQATRCNHILYTAPNVGITLKNAFLIIDPTSAIGVWSLNTSRADVDGTNRRGVRIEDGTIIINTSDDSHPAGANAQRPSIIRINATAWASVEKTEISPLQLKNSSLIFTTSENGNSNALVISYAVADGLGGSKIIRDPNLTATNDRLFVGAAAIYRNTDIVNWPKITFSDLARNLGIQEFDGCRIFGASSKLDLQGLSILRGTRFQGNTLTSNLIEGFYGSPAISRRASRCYINMTFLIDGGVTSNNNTFALIQKNTASLLHLQPQFFLNEYDLSVKDAAGDGIEDVSVVGFLRETTGNLTRETALDFSDRYQAYAYDSTRYGNRSQSDWDNAGVNIRTRILGNFSLPGQNELITNADGDTIVSGESVITRPQLRAVEIQYQSSSSTTVIRTNYTGHKFRVSKYGKIGQDVTVAIGQDTLDDASNEPVNIVMLDDGKITESTKSTVAAYTSITDLNEMYDFIRHLEHDNRGVPGMKRISYTGKTITFPTGSTFQTSDTQSEAITVDYSGTSPVYTFKGSDTIGLPDNGNFDAIDLTATGDKGDVDFAVDVATTDSSGTTIVFSVSQGDTIIRIDEYDADTGEYLRTVTGTSNSAGIYSSLFSGGKRLEIYAKKYRYNFKHVTIQDTSDVTTEIVINLDLLAHIEASIDLSDYILEAAAGIANKIYFNYVADGKSQWVGGDINTSGKLRLTEALLDNRISTQEGLNFFADYEFKVRNIPPLQIDLPTGTGTAYSISHDDSDIWLIDATNTTVDKITYSDRGADDPVHTEVFSIDGTIEARGLDIHKDKLWIGSIGTVPRIYVYNKTGVQQTSDEFDLPSPNANPAGVAGKGDKLFVVDSTELKVFEYNDDYASNVVTPTEHALTAENANPVGITWDAEAGLFYVLDSTDVKLYAYDEEWNYKEHYDIDLDSTLHTAVAGVKADSGRLWVIDRTARKVFAYATFASQDQFQAGSPYLVGADRGSINQYALEFVRAAGATTGIITRLGIAMYNWDEETAYVAPLSNGGNVAFDNLAVNVNTPESAITDAIEQVLNDADVLDTISERVWDRAASDVDDSGSIGRQLKEDAAAIKAKTDKLQFNDEDHVVSTADVETTGLATQSSVDTISTEVTGIKAKTDKLNFNASDDVIATLDGESTTQSYEHLFVIDESDKLVYAYTSDGHPINSLNIGVPHVNDLEGITEYKGYFYVLDSPSSGTRHLYVYRDNESRAEGREFDLHGDNASPQDLAIVDDKLYVLDNTAGSIKIFVYDINTKQRLASEDRNLPGAENVLGLDIYNNHAYVTDARTDPNHTKRVLVYDLADGPDGAAVTNMGFNLPASASLPTGITIDGDRIRICDQQSTSRIYTFDLGGTRITGEEFDLADENDHPRGITFLKSSPHGIKEISSNTELIRGQTDRLKFASDDDIISTLDSEEVTTDAASRTASKADISTLATQASVDTVDTVVDAVKAKTDKLNFSNDDDVKATLDGEAVSGGGGLTLSQESRLNAIKTKTDKLNFNSDDDVKATLDNEEVTTDAASRTASKADVSTLATQASVNTVDTVVDAIKLKTDKLGFSATDDVKATLDNEEVDVGKVKGTAVTDINSFKTSAADIAAAVEAGLLDEADGRLFLNAIKEKLIEAIDSEDISGDTLVSAIWAKDSTTVTDGSFGDMIRRIKTTGDLLEKFHKADIEVTDTNVIFRYDSEELVRFSRRSSTTTADYSGGRDRVV